MTGHVSYYVILFHDQAWSNIRDDFDSASRRRHVDLTLNQCRLKYRRFQRQISVLVAISAHCITYGICTATVYVSIYFISRRTAFNLH